MIVKDNYRAPTELAQLAKKRIGGKRIKVLLEELLQ
jgi:hypothetical protein